MDGDPVEVNETSIWQTIACRAPPSEHAEMRRVVGESLIDEAETLHTEVSALLEIWREFRATIAAEETELEETSQQRQILQSALPEPPMVREVLKREISFFVDTLREKNAPLNLEESSERIVDYALDRDKGVGDRPSSVPNRVRRPSTARVSGRETPLRPMTSRSEGASATTLPRRVDFETELPSLQGKILVFTLDSVVEQIRQAIKDECEALMKDSEFLNQCLEGEIDHRLSLIQPASGAEPSLQDMRQLRSYLEKEYFAAKGGNDTQRTSLSGISVAMPAKPSGPLKAPVVRPGTAPRPSSTSSSGETCVRELRPLSGSSRLGKPSAGLCTPPRRSSTGSSTGASTPPRRTSLSEAAEDIPSIVPENGSARRASRASRIVAAGSQSKSVKPRPPPGKASPRRPGAQINGTRGPRPPPSRPGSSTTKLGSNTSDIRVAQISS